MFDKTAQIHTPVAFHVAVNVTSRELPFRAILGVPVPQKSLRRPPKTHEHVVTYLAQQSTIHIPEALLTYVYIYRNDQLQSSKDAVRRSTLQRTRYTSTESRSGLSERPRSEPSNSTRHGKLPQPPRIETVFRIPIAIKSRKQGTARRSARLGQ